MTPVVERIPSPLREAEVAGVGIARAAAEAAGPRVERARRGGKPAGGSLGARLSPRRGLLRDVLAGAVLLAAWALLWSSFLTAVVEPAGRLHAPGARAPAAAAARDAGSGPLAGAGAGSRS